ncbi:hypothetical protein LCGC14_0357520 [marine sediment metagenome]|uniref:Phage virion morphogenesis protein n=1 Tax=marine sediment metagenome TaxID=412755 RepID=A0A0F9WHC4_9ZZZZ
MASVKLNLEPLKRFVLLLANDLRGSGFGPVRNALKKWAARYRGAVQRRFVKMSKGGWPRLKRRRKRGARNRALVLRDTGHLLAALDAKFTRKPGQLEQKILFGVRVGYGGSMAHPVYSGITIAKLAEYHQTGAGSLPVRETIVGTDKLSPSLVPGMRKDMSQALRELAKTTGN